MDEEMIYVLPTKKKKNLSKRSFVLLSLCLSLVLAIIISILIVPSVGSMICGFVPVGLVAFGCATGQLVGTIYYIKKHKYAYGDNYEWYQIINSTIYGIQSVLRVLLVVLLINICAVPIFVLLISIYIFYLFRKMFRR